MRNPFYISSNCPKHYFAGTQRVSSKIGTTENVGDYLYDWFTQGTGGPVDVIGSSFGVLENAEDGVVQVYDEFGIDPPTYESNPVFIPVQNFVHGGNEVEQYFFHPDHLGSTSYITNLLGEVSQHMEYFAFGATERKSLAVFLEGCERSSFVEEHRSSNNSPYKFNGKELDEETGWYYYGARYYDPRISVWLSVDPLANVDYLMNNEAFINGEHNGGVYNSFNHNSYSYTYQNPVIYVDPNGKQTKVIRKVDIYYSMANDRGTRDLKYQNTYETATASGYNESEVYVLDNDGGKGNELFSGPLAVSNYHDKLKSGNLKVYDKPVKNYNINSEEFANTKETINSAIAADAIINKIKSVVGLEKLVYNPRGTPITALSPDKVESITDINLIKSAKYRLLTLGVGNSVDIPIVPSIINSEYTPIFGEAKLKILYKGVGNSGNPIFEEKIKDLNYAKGN